MRELHGLKICFLAGTLGQGGAERQLFYMLSALKQAGAMPRVLCLGKHEHWHARIEAIGIPVTWVGQSRFRLLRLWRIVQELRRDRPDVFQSQHFYTNIYVTAAVRLLGLRDVGALRSDAIGELGANHGLLGKWSLKTPRIIAANSQAGIENAVSLGAIREKLFFLPNVVDTSLFTPSSGKANGRIRLLTVGRMVPVKRFDRFVRAVSAVDKHATVPVEGLVVGDGPLRADLQLQAEKLGLQPCKLRFCGTAEETDDFYQDADVLVLTSDREGTPNVVLEAMACGIPVVATRVGGLPALVRHGETGYLVDPNDEGALTKAVLDLVENPDRRTAFGRSAREFVESHYNLAHLESELRRLYDVVLSSSTVIDTVPKRSRSPQSLAERLLVVTNVVHYQNGGRFFAYGPYALEIRSWAKLFSELVLASPCRTAIPPSDCLALPRNVSVIPQPETGGTTFFAKLVQLVVLPYSTVRLCVAMRGVDAVHIRCPGNLGLLGVILTPLFHRQRVAKFAGQWEGYDGERWTVRLQRRLLRSWWWRAPVLAYTDEKNEPAHVVPFFNSALTSSQIARANATAITRPHTPPNHILYTGRLSHAKNVHVLLDAVAVLLEEGKHLSCTIVGEGPERGALEKRAEALGIQDCVAFVGGVSPEAVLSYYETADILVLASETEGWPKTITEGMAFGLICVGLNRGLVTTMLGEGRGFLVEPGNSEALTKALRDVCRMAPYELAQMRARATSWASRFTTEHFQESLRSTLENRWTNQRKRYFHVPLAQTKSAPPDQVGVMHLTDTLEIGGAERMAVSLANALPRAQFRAHICTTRRSGPLSDMIGFDVGKLSLNRRRTLDVMALWRLVQYIRHHDIRILHAHGTAVFVSAAASLFWPYPMIVWHIHYGKHAAERSSGWQYRAIRTRIQSSIAVSEALAGWATKIIGMPPNSVTYIPNFSSSGRDNGRVELPGEKGERIVCVANFQQEKDHLTLLRAMERVVQVRPKAHLSLVGGGSNSQWGHAVAREIGRIGLERNVTLLGQRRDVSAILHAADIGVLSSKVEGLPLALIEYGEAGLPAVVTAVGQCADVVDHGNAGIAVQPQNDEQLADAILTLLGSSEQRADLGAALRRRVQEQFNADNCIKTVYATYQHVLNNNGK